MMGYKRAQYSEVMARINEPRSKMQAMSLHWAATYIC